MLVDDTIDNSLDNTIESSIDENKTVQIIINIIRHAPFLDLYR